MIKTLINFDLKKDKKYYYKIVFAVLSIVINIIIIGLQIMLSVILFNNGEEELAIKFFLHIPVTTFLILLFVLILVMIVVVQYLIFKQTYKYVVENY